MTQRWKRLGLAQRMTLMIACILIVPTMLIGTFYYQSYKHSLLTEAEAGLQRSLTAMSRTMDDNLDTTEHVLRELDYSQELLYVLDGANPISSAQTARSLESLQKQWVDIRYANPNLFTQLTIYSSRSALTGQGSWMFAIHDLSELDPHALGEEGAVSYTTPQRLGSIDRQDNITVVDSRSSMLPAWFPVRNFRTGTLIGGVKLELSLEKLLGDRTLQEAYTDTAFFLMDQEGQLLYQTGAYSAAPLAQTKFSGDGTTQELSLDGQRYLAASSRCEKTGLMRVALISQSKAIQGAQTMIGWVSLVAVLGVLCIIALTHLTIRRLLSRLVVLDDVIGQIKTGDFTAAVPEDDYHDEISRVKSRFNDMTAQLRRLIRTAVEREKAQKDAEMRALQAQVNPHFLYNTLESMRMQCEIDRYYKVGDGLAALGNLLHYTAQWQDGKVLFGQEWAYLKSYIAVMAIRLDTDFSYEMTCDQQATEIEVPKMLLQPLVENSFQHGFRAVPPPWRLEIHAMIQDNCLRIVMWDNGIGLSPRRLNQLRTCLETRVPPQHADGSQSIGLVNLMQRIDLACKPGSGILLENRPERGAQITVTIQL